MLFTIYLTPIRWYHKIVKNLWKDKQMEKLITFCVASYNSEAYMRICLDSLLLGGEEVEIIIVNDGSKDKTGQIADEYQAKYPNICVAVHQSNGGHGDAINHALSLAKGIYFKVVDSDDWVDKKGYELVLTKVRENKNPDLYLCNYQYFCGNDNPSKIVQYRKRIPSNKEITWGDFKRFMLEENLTLHSCMYKTSILKESGVVLPKHMKYEDNFMIYVPMPFCKTIYYIDHVFYCYLIGRDGQSVSYEVSIKNYADFLRVAELTILSHDISKIKKSNHKLYTVLFHHERLYAIIGIMYARLNHSKEAKKRLKDFWETIKNSSDKKIYGKLKYRSLATFMVFPGVLGRLFVKIIYGLSHKAVPFNNTTTYSTKKTKELIKK